MTFPNIAETPSGGKTWWGGTPSPILRDEIAAIAEKERVRRPGCDVQFAPRSTRGKT